MTPAASRPPPRPEGASSPAVSHANFCVKPGEFLAILGHNGSGKTSLAEAILYKAGASDRLGKTADGTTVCDYDPEEIKRKISIGTSLASFEYNDLKVNLLDTPGLFDFAAEMIEGIRASDTVMITVSAK